MKIASKVLLCVTLSFACIFTCIGYAQLSDSLSVLGNADVTPPNILYITNVEEGSVGDIGYNSLYYSQTIVSSTVTLEKDTDNTEKAVYKITFWNNTSVPYYYLAMVHGTYTDENGTVPAYSNPNIVLSADISLGDEIAPGATREVTITATFQKGADTTDKTLTSTIEYQFGLEKPENNDQAAVSGVLGRFPDILNDSEDYAALTDALDKNTTHPDYIGNVVGFWGINNDIATVENLFGVALELNVDGENKPVTVIIQRKNVDGNEETGDTYTYQEGWYNPTIVTSKGNEMIMFMTAADLDRVSGGSYVEVYAVVYTRNTQDGEWYQIGEMYKGSARVVGYILGTTLTHDSFNPDTWRELDENGNRTNNTLETVLAR